MRGPTPISLAERFWFKTSAEDGCVLWTAHVNNRGYGQIWVNEHSRKELAHRTSWFLETGAWPTKQVLHKCDKPRCVKFEHLFLGSQADNITDMLNKGRHKGWTGGDNYNAVKTHCPQGHPYEGTNLVLYEYGKYTYRRCRACIQRWIKERKENG